MPGIRWCTDPQHEYLMERLDNFIVARQSGRKAQKRFWSPVFKEYFTRWPLLPELVVVQDLDECVLEKGYTMTEAERKVYSAALEKRKEKIKTVLRYQMGKLVGDVGVSSGKRTAVTKATQHFVKIRSRCHQQAEVYYSLNKAKVDAAFEQEMADRKSSPGDEDGESEKESDEDSSSESSEDDEQRGGSTKTKKRKGEVHIRNRISRRMLAEASEEERQEIERIIDEEREDRAAQAAQDAVLVGLKRPPKARQESLQNAPGFMVANAQTLWDTSAAVTLQIAVAPDPLREGKLWSRVIGFGKGKDDLLFHQSYPNFQDEFVSPFYQWARQHIFTFDTPLPVVSPEDIGTFPDQQVEEEEPPTPSPEPVEAPACLSSTAGEDSRSASLPRLHRQSQWNRSVPPPPPPPKT
ncbi:hypothetical protein DFP72DRAFT_1080525, partial [Ephemerocybe angulata]